MQGLPTLPWSGPDGDLLSGLSLRGPRAAQGGALHSVVQRHRLSTASFLNPRAARPAVPCEISKLASPLPFQPSKMSHSQEGFETHTHTHTHTHTNTHTHRATLRFPISTKDISSCNKQNYLRNELLIKESGQLKTKWPFCG